jgi:hypothetical protein
MVEEFEKELELMQKQFKLQLETQQQFQQQFLQQMQLQLMQQLMQQSMQPSFSQQLPQQISQLFPQLFPMNLENVNNDIASPSNFAALKGGSNKGSKKPSPPPQPRCPAIPPLAPNQSRNVDVCVYILGDVAPALTVNRVLAELDIASRLWGIDFNPSICDLRLPGPEIESRCLLDSANRNVRISQNQLPVNPTDPITPELQNVFNMRNENCPANDVIGVFYINVEEFPNGADARFFSAAGRTNIVMTRSSYDEADDFGFLAHELGHALGIQGHTTTPNNIMNALVPAVLETATDAELASLVTDCERATVYSSPFVYILTD